ncbi:MAG: carbohydrate kinase family protein [Candidatus Berkelbacteria bacterium]|nr:carbohydrate kinase family protein [Candidatus Berkelbacteria bacterium]
MYDVVTIGDAFQDLFVFSADFKVLPDRSFRSGNSLSFDYGAKIDVEKIEYHSGGSAVNTAICFSKIGLETSILSFIGNDSPAEKIISEIENSGISTDLLKNDSQPTNTSVILSHDGDRTILAYHGDRNFNDLTLAKSLKASWFYLSPIGNESDQLENKLIENIAKNGTGLIWNPGPSQIKQGAKANRHLLRLCNILILNREEALNFSGCGKSKTDDCLKSLHEIGAKIVIATDGKYGAKAFDGEVFYQIDSSPDKRVDATGAGDAFASSMAARIILESGSEKPQSFLPNREVISESLKWGIVNSGAVVSQVGANTGLLSKSEIIENSGKLVKLEAKVYS